MEQEPIKIFYCYAREDEALRDRLAKHLETLRREGLIVTWYDRDITAGDDYQQRILLNIETADIFLALISPDFMRSDYCHNVEIRRALDKNILGELRVIPVILRSVDWEDTPLGELQALPKDGKPVMKWKPVDDGWQNVAEGIRKVVKELWEPKPALNTEISNFYYKYGYDLLHGDYGGYDVEETIAAFRKAVHFDPDNLDAWSEMAIVLFEHGRFVEAFDAFKQVIRLDPKNTKAWLGIARIHLYFERYEKALLVCERMFQLQKETNCNLMDLKISFGFLGSQNIYEVKIDALENLGRFEEAQDIRNYYESIKREREEIDLEVPEDLDNYRF